MSSFLFLINSQYHIYFPFVPKLFDQIITNFEHILPQNIIFAEILLTYVTKAFIENQNIHVYNLFFTPNWGISV